MRHVVGDRIGRTDFFRNSAFLQALVELLKAENKPQVLVHAAATGAEPYSIVMAGRLSGVPHIQVDATDIEPSFLAIARTGVYEAQSVAKLPEPARAFFTPGPEPGTVEVVADVRDQVRFLEPASFVHYETATTYDAVLALNALTYVSEAEQRQAIARMSAYARTYLCLTAASPRIIKSAIQSVGFEILERPDWYRIYYGWWDRIRLRPGRRDWALPMVPFQLKDWRYAGSTIFRRCSGALVAPTRP